MTTAPQIPTEVEEQVFQEQNASQQNNEKVITNDGTNEGCSLKEPFIKKYFEQCFGSLKLPIKLNSNGRITVKFVEKGKTYFQTVRYLRPINVYFKFSSNNQSTFKPVLLLHCDWLSTEHLQRIGKQLDDLWDADQGKVLHSWSAFSQSDLLKFLQIKDEIIIVSTEIGEYSSDYKENMELLDDLLVYEPDIEKEADRSENAWWFDENKGENFPIENVIKEKLHAKYFLLGKHQKFLITSDSIRLFDSTLFGKDKKEPFKMADEHQFYDILNRNYNKNKENIGNRITFLNERDISVKMHSMQQYNLLVFNKLKHTCEICMDTYDGSLCILLSCGHVFCKECMKSYVMERIENNNVGHLTCASFNCKVFIYDSELKGILSDDDFLKLKELKLKHAIYNNPELIFCPRESCKNLAFLEKDGNQIIGYCYYCKFCFCVKCFKKYHGTTPCKEDENSDDEVRPLEATHQLQSRENHLSQQWIEKQAKQCPKCYVLTHKAFGCNNVVCGRCKCEFCWVCGRILDSKLYSRFYTEYNACFEHLYDRRPRNIRRMNNTEINDNQRNNGPNVGSANSGTGHVPVMDILMEPQNLLLVNSYDSVANRGPTNNREINDNQMNNGSNVRSVNNDTGHTRVMNSLLEPRDL